MSQGERRPRGEGGGQQPGPQARLRLPGQTASPAPGDSLGLPRGPTPPPHLPRSTATPARGSTTGRKCVEDAGRGEKREGHLAGKRSYLWWRILECSCRRRRGGKCKNLGGGESSRKNSHSGCGTSKQSFETPERHLAATWGEASRAEAGEALASCAGRSPAQLACLRGGGWGGGATLGSSPGTDTS